MSVPDLKHLHPSLAFHLSDTSNVPILSSSSDTPSNAWSSSPSSSFENEPSISNRCSDAAALSSLTSSFLSAFETASRLKLGDLKRVSAETDTGIGLVQSYIPFPQLVDEAEGATANGFGNGMMKDGMDNLERGRRRKGISDGENRERPVEGADEVEADEPPPPLVATVVAPSKELMVEAGLAALELEGVARAFHEAWMNESASRVEGGDGDGYNV